MGQPMKESRKVEGYCPGCGEPRVRGHIDHQPHCPYEGQDDEDEMQPGVAEPMEDDVPGVAEPMEDHDESKEPGGPGHAEPDGDEDENGNEPGQDVDDAEGNDNDKDDEPLVEDKPKHQEHNDDMFMQPEDKHR